jgi:hypothetical protein
MFADPGITLWSPRAAVTRATDRDRRRNVGWSSAAPSTRRVQMMWLSLLLLGYAPLSRAWRTHDVREYGARGDGQHLDTPHIQAAIDAAVSDGGGVVLLPPSTNENVGVPTTYVSSGITLGSNLVFRISRGAVLGSSRRWADYPYTLVLATDCAPGPCLEWRRHPLVLFSSCTKPVNPGRPDMRCDEWNRVHNVTLDG